MHRKPKALVHADALAAVEQSIVDALLDIVEGLSAKAREGDVKAAVYLCDRILGRVAGTVTAPAEGRQAPYSENDHRLEATEREKDTDLRRLLAGCGAMGRG
jgi:hypothetical protein